MHTKLTLTGSSVARSDGGGADVENGGDVDVVPLFLGEGVSAISNIRLVPYLIENGLTSSGYPRTAHIKSRNLRIKHLHLLLLALLFEVSGVLSGSHFLLLDVMMMFFF
jgi:hypothetical protein